MKPTQQTLATAGFELHRKRTRRDAFLAQMDQVVPWAKLCALIEPLYPKGEGAGRPTIGLERMLRIYFLQQWFNLSDPAVEESLYDSVSMRQFVGIDLGREERFGIAHLLALVRVRMQAQHRLLHQILGKLRRRSSLPQELAKIAKVSDERVHAARKDCTART